MQQTLMEIGFVVSCVLGVCCIVFSTANEVYEYPSLSSPWKPWNTPGKISYLNWVYSDLGGSGNLVIHITLIIGHPWTITLMKLVSDPP